VNQDSIILRCPNCSAKNRVARNRLQDKPICAKCRTPLTPGDFFDRPVLVTDRTFSNVVLSSPYPVVVDCWAPWCGPCRMVAPILDQLAMEYAGRVKIAKLNVDENHMTASRYSTQSIPTLLFFKEGELVDRLVGVLPKAEIERHVRALL
jgi:thioredoxin 2